MMCDSRLEQVAGAIQFMHRGEVRPTFARFGKREIGVQISVRLLGGRDLGNHRVKRLVQVGIGLRRQRVRRAFDHLVQVGIIEVDALELAGRQLSRLGEVVDASGLLAPLDVVRQGYDAIDFQAGRPKTRPPVSPR